MIRLAQLSDMPDLITMAQCYSTESQQHRHLSVERTQETFEAHIGSSEAAVYVADAGENGLAAASITMIDRSFTVKPQAIVGYFYVLEPYRGTPVARRLLAQCVYFAENAGCSHIWAGANGMIDPQSTRMFENLCAKQGFEPGGMTMFRRF